MVEKLWIGEGTAPHMSQDLIQNTMRVVGVKPLFLGITVLILSSTLSGWWKTLCTSHAYARDIVCHTFDSSERNHNTRSSHPACIIGVGRTSIGRATTSNAKLDSLLEAGFNGYTRYWNISRCLGCPFLGWITQSVSVQQEKSLEFFNYTCAWAMIVRWIMTP